MVNNGPNLINIDCERPLRYLLKKIVYWKCLAVFSIPFKDSFVAPDCGSLLMVLLRSNVFYELWTMKVPLVCLRSGLSIKSKRGIILILTQTYISNGCHRPRGQIWQGRLKRWTSQLDLGNTTGGLETVVSLST